SATEARRLACAAGIIPVVLGGAGQVLDVGRRRRFHTGAQRIAMAVRDHGCTAQGCDRPPAMCHAHHDRPWSQGGNTDLKTGRLLRGHHHRRIHDPAYTSTHHPNGKVTFHRRT
ncbi:MAG: HNH endonuclease signature motif containing protein, partial [Marmoricola sp.]